MHQTLKMLLKCYFLPAITKSIEMQETIFKLIDKHILELCAHEVCVRVETGVTFTFLLCFMLNFMKFVSKHDALLTNVL